MTPLLTIAAVGLAGGLALLAVGLRGRRVDDHRLCRGCGYDLTGLPAGAARCSECGRDLTAKRAVRVGHRERRRWAVVLSVLLALPSAAVVAGLLWAANSDFDWQRHKPVGWLAGELSSRDSAVVNAALAELLRRQVADEDGEIDFGPAVDAVLEWQGDGGRAWDGRAGDLVEGERHVGRVSDADWSRYARQGFVPRLDVRPVVRQGELMPAVVRFETRWGEGQPPFRGKVVARGLTVGPRESPSFAAAEDGVEDEGRNASRPLSGVFAYEREFWQNTGSDADSDGMHEGFSDLLTSDFTWRLATASHAAAADVRVLLFPDANTGLADATNKRLSTNEADAVAAWDATLTATVKLLPEPAPPPQYGDDADVDAAMRRSVTVEPIEAWSSDRTGQYWRVPIHLREPPLPYPFRASLRFADGTEVPLERDHGGLSTFGNPWGGRWTVAHSLPPVPVRRAIARETG